MVNNQDNFEFQFSATQIQVNVKQNLKTLKFKKQNYTKTVDHNNVLGNDKRLARILKK